MLCYNAPSNLYVGICNLKFDVPAAYVTAPGKIEDVEMQEDRRSTSSDDPFGCDTVTNIDEAIRNGSISNHQGSPRTSGGNNDAVNHSFQDDLGEPIYDSADGRNSGLSKVTVEDLSKIDQQQEADNSENRGDEDKENETLEDGHHDNEDKDIEVKEEQDSSFDSAKLEIRQEDESVETESPHVQQENDEKSNTDKAESQNENEVAGAASTDYKSRSDGVEHEKVREPGENDKDTTTNEEKKLGSDDALVV